MECRRSQFRRLYSPGYLPVSDVLTVPASSSGERIKLKYLLPRELKCSSYVFVESVRLLRLDWIHHNLVFGRIQEILQIGKLRPAIFLGKVALSGLNNRRDLNHINIPRFDLCLHQKMYHAADFLTENTQIDDFLLKSDGLKTTDPPAIICQQPAMIKKLLL